MDIYFFSKQAEKPQVAALLKSINNKIKKASTGFIIYYILYLNGKANVLYLKIIIN
jgi:hypothetical protein